MTIIHQQTAAKSEKDKCIILNMIDSCGVNDINKFLYESCAHSFPSSVYTDVSIGNEGIEKDIEYLLVVTPEEPLEDGKGNTFSEDIVNFVKKGGKLAIEKVYSLIISDNRVIPELASEALRLLGKINQPETYQLRLELLTKCLNSPSIWIRDGAILGLAYLKDSNTIIAIKEAIRKENKLWLRNYMEKVLKRIEDANRCH